MKSRRAEGGTYEPSDEVDPDDDLTGNDMLGNDLADVFKSQ